MNPSMPSDTRYVVLDNYQKWKGEAPNIFTPPDSISSPDLSPRFGILEYSSSPQFNTYCTVGASYKIIPHSDCGKDGCSGVRFEYILHAPPQHRIDACELLLTVASYPFIEGFEYYAGCVLPIDDPVVEQSSMTHLYFTYPYLDDPKIYDTEPYGQIKIGSLLIQTLWVFPVYESEAEYVRSAGADAFEQCCYERHLQQYDAFDFFRIAIV
jgi:hypothetical protein